MLHKVSRNPTSDDVVILYLLYRRKKERNYNFYSSLLTSWYQMV
jgi:hypothetical protein